MTQNNTPNIPTHLGIILDGNRRWAHKRGLKGVEGHMEGFKTLQGVADYALEKGVKYFSVYAFSTENWARDKEEVKYLMALLRQMLKKEIANLHKKSVRFLWFGQEDKLDSKLIKQLNSAVELTKNNKKGTFNLCFNYGGRAEIVQAAINAAKSGDITEETIANNLYGGSEIPDIDLLIRTSGEQRISNFMLWRVAYSELYFSSKLWPDFSKIDLDEAMAEYASRQRRFGK